MGTYGTNQLPPGIRPKDGWSRKGINKNISKGMTGNLKSYTTKVFEDSNKNFIATEVRELEKLLKEKENEVK
jgi:hypothetical protein